MVFDFTGFPHLAFLACRTGVIFYVFQANRGESEASAKKSRGVQFRQVEYVFPK